MQTLWRAHRGAPLLFALVLASSALAGCTTTRGRADDAYAKGDYAAAAKLYQEVLASNPNDKEVQANLQTARTQAITAFLVAIDAQRQRGNVDDSLDKLDELLRTRQSWNHHADAAVDARIATEATWAAGVVRFDVMKLVDAGLPLKAQAALGARKVMTREELAASAQELHGSIDAAGLKGCSRLTATSGAAAPYFTRFASAYCTHFHGAPPASVPLPNVVSGVDLYSAVAGLDDAQRASMTAAVSRWLASSLWYGASPRHAAAVASGRQQVAFGVHAETITRPWVESVPYEDTEAYEESYTITEQYTEHVPYTDYETVPCASGTAGCTEQRPTTRYRDESRTRDIPKTRTRHRQVTRYRDVARTFTFEARKHTGQYESAFTVRIDLGEGVAPLDITSTTTVQQEGLEHDVSFPPAGVAPSRPNLLTADAFLTSRLEALGAEFPALARDHWKKSFCTGASFTPETAARCAYASSPTFPEAVRTALATSLGKDVDLALALPR